MKKPVYLLVLFAVFIMLDSCGFLGIGKQCYTCTTQAASLSQASKFPKITKEFCDAKEMEQYKKDAPKNVGGVIIQTVCQTK